MAASTRLLQRIRDEAHRFAVTYHRVVRHRRLAQSRLDAVVGIGPARKRALLAKFGSVERLATATEEEIATVPGIPGSLARLLLRALKDSDPRRVG
jgi:excinuclease ABC subunit C